MKTLSLIFTIIFTIIGFVFKIVFGLIGFGLSVLSAAQLAEDKENGYR